MSQRRSLEQLHRDEHAVGADDDDRRRAGRLVEALRLHDRDAEALGGLLGGRRADPTATSLRPIGPREHELDLVPLREPFEHGSAERRGRRDDELHGSERPGSGLAIEHKRLDERALMFECKT